MHFECSEQLIRSWGTAGLLSDAAVPPPPPLLVLGDRGPEIAKLQTRLNAVADARLPADGVFGHATFAAVIGLQGSRGLHPDGAVGARTWAALGEG